MLFNNIIKSLSNDKKDYIASNLIKIKIPLN